MSRVVGADAALHAALEDGPDGLVVVALPQPAGPVGAMATDDLAALVDAALLPAFRALREERDRAVIVCPASAVLPDHRDGARSVVAAGLAMLGEVASAAAPVNVVAVADDVPAADIAAAVRFALTTPSLNGATIRLDGGRDAVLAAVTRSEED